ncbi:hypothetical protein HanIR_Chr15g0734911 [Helianthus annuus]|nr:hypothetical protein HanIR_Chr15g0734911 [Helianthus annuus]
MDLCHKNWTTIIGPTHTTRGHPTHKTTPHIITNRTTRPNTRKKHRKKHYLYVVYNEHCIADNIGSLRFARKGNKADTRGTCIHDKQQKDHHSPFDRSRHHKPCICWFQGGHGSL